MNKLSTLLWSLGIGAGLMYFFDPSRGNRRRALVRDQVVSLRERSDDALDVAMRDLRNRTRGVLAEAMGRLSEEGSPDWLVAERVRAELGRLIRYSSAIEVNVDSGRIFLRGPILAPDADRVVRHVSRVRGVKGVENQLEVHQDPGDIPALQGATPGIREMARPEWQQENWSPSMRLLSGLGGGLMTLYGMTRRGLIGTAMSVAGLGLAARGVLNIDLKSMLGMGGQRHAININKAININAPVDQVYQFWSNFENLPRFMAHLKQVKDMGNGRSHWVATGPAGTTAEWDAVVTRQVPNELISWESIEGSEVKTSGMVRFRQNPVGGTRVTVHLNYTPPAGVIGHAVAALFGTDPKQAMDEDLVRLKSLFETGKTTVEGREVTGPDIAGAGATI